METSASGGSIPPNPSQTKTILVVDDSATSRNLIRVYLMGMGFEFLEADRAEAALALLATTPVDIIVADVTMPGMGGLAFVRKVRVAAEATMRRVPIVLLTSDKSRETRARGMAAGADGFVLKPVTSSNLRETISSLLEHKPA